ncbi:hypothetical protein [Nocardia otitidiscaviarum]|uniref:hypothetical protein n=1 Tax=Nocardia otitidiscaviarum TaxID=1823 RepID=UPI0004A701FC|nr:hypothetical protein [Nocardia otitidiscaviarum]
MTLNDRIEQAILGFSCWRYRARTGTYQWLAHRLPAPLRYFAAIDVGAYATTGNYSDTVVTDLTMMEAIDRFGRDKGVHAA